MPGDEDSSRPYHASRSESLWHLLILTPANSATILVVLGVHWPRAYLLAYLLSNAWRWRTWSVSFLKDFHLRVRKGVFEDRWVIASTPPSKLLGWTKCRSDRTSAASFTAE